MTHRAHALLHVVALAATAALAACGGTGTSGAADDQQAAEAPPARTAAAAPPPRPAVAAPGAPGEARVPARFHGHYAVDDAACTSPGAESRLVLRADRIEFHESAGPVRSASAEGNMLTLVVELTGEGGAREAAYQFGLAEDGGSLHDLANGLARRRCD